MELCPWSGYTPATIVFCERRLCSIVVEPANAWSNLAFLVAAVFLFLHDRKEKNGILGAVKVTAVLVGLGSFAFHATGTFWGEVLDVGAMYMIGGLFVTFNLRRLFPAWTDARLLTIYVTQVIAAILAMLWSPHTNIPVFAAQITVAVLLEAVLRRTGRTKGVKYKHAFLMAGGFALAFGVWALDITGILCDPDNHVFGGHAFWHVGSAWSLYQFHRFHAQMR